MSNPLSKSDSQGEFSVCWWDQTGAYHFEKRFCDVEEAVKTAVSLIRRPAAKIGVIIRVIITDGGDCCNWEWLHDKGIVYPPSLYGRR